MPKLQIDVSDDQLAYLVERAEVYDISVEEYVAGRLSPPPEPEPKPPSFDFKGTVVKSGLLDMWYVLIDGENDTAYFSELAPLREAKWQYKYFVKGARVEGVAQKWPNGAIKILWMVPAEMGLSNIRHELTVLEKIQEKFTYISWLFNYKSRKQALEVALERWEESHPETKTAGA